MPIRTWAWYAFLLAVVWFFGHFLVVFAVDGASTLVGYRRASRIEQQRSRIVKKLDQLDAGSARPKDRAEARVHLLGKLDALEKKRPLPAKLDEIAEWIVTLGPWALMGWFLIWVQKQEAHQSRPPHRSRARRVAAEVTSPAPLPSPVPEEPVPVHTNCVRRFHLSETAVVEAPFASPPPEKAPPRPAPPAVVPNIPAATDAMPDDDERGDEHDDEDTSLRRFLTVAEWYGSHDGRDLLRHAVPRIPRQHLSLVLAELAEELWQEFHAWHPDDWRPAWAIATVRAWCFGEATVEEVLKARELASSACAHWNGRAKRENTSSFEVYCAAGVAAMTTAYVGGSNDEEDETWPDAAESLLFWAIRDKDPLETAIEEAFTISLHARDVGRGYAEFGTWDSERDAAKSARHRREWARYADWLRARIPYPARRSKTWRILDASVVVSGGATLQIRGWQIVAANGSTEERRGQPRWIN